MASSALDLAAPADQELDATLQVSSSRPLVFLPAPEYPVTNLDVSGQLKHGANLYSLLATVDQELFAQALELRRHSEERLDSHKFLTLENYSTWSDLHLSAGVDAKDFLVTPMPTTRTTRRVVAIDCEMVGVLRSNQPGSGERNELAQICAVDVLTGEVLVNKLVRPRERVSDWRTRYSGVSYPAILAADRAGRLLRGWKAARAELLSFIDSDTILVGHSLYNDLHMLRLAHSKIVDTSILTAEAVFGDKERLDRVWGLKDLAKSLTNLPVQVGRRGHDCIEDTLATRELAIWCIRFPSQLAAWAEATRLELAQKKLERDKKLEEQRQKRLALAKQLEKDAEGRAEALRANLQNLV